MGNITPVVYESIIDVSSNNNFNQISIVQGDSESLRTVKLTLISNNTVYNIPDDINVYLIGTKPDDNMVMYECNHSGNIVTFDVQEQMVTSPGKCTYQIILMDESGTVLHSFPFHIVCVKSQVDNVTSTSDFAVFREAIDESKKTYSEVVAQATYQANRAKQYAENIEGSLSQYAKKTDIPSLNEYAKKTDIPSLEGYAKKTDIPASPDLSSYAKKTDIPTMPDLSSYAKKTDIPATPDLSGYAKKNEIPDTSNFATKDEIPTLPDMTQYATKEDLNDIDLTDYAKKTDLDNISLDNYVSQDDFDNIDFTDAEWKISLNEDLENIDFTKEKWRKK